MAGKSLDTIQRRVAVLKSLQSRLQWPRLTQFQAVGQTYRLPYHSTSKVDVDVSDPVIRYLAGFFDGDGCVSSSSNRVQLGISQCHANSEVLILFQRVFGGVIYAQVHGRGLRRPCLQWRVTGADVKEVAAKLVKHSFVKRGQLLVAAPLPEQKQQEQAVQKQRAPLNLEQSDPNLACSWAYIAGFFDAEGCIRALPSASAVSVSMSQKDRSVLSWIDNFWRVDLRLTSSCSLQKTGVTEMTVSSKYYVQLLLRRLLANGLLGKRQQALLGLSLGSVPYGDIRNGLNKLSGNQGRYQHLTEEGCQRSRGIRLMQGTFARRLAAGKLEEAEQLQRQVEAMREQHKLLNTMAVYDALRRDIRSLLSQGAVTC